MSRKFVGEETEATKCLVGTRSLSRSNQSYDILQVYKCGFCYHIEVLKVCILQVCKSDATGRGQVWTMHWCLHFEKVVQFRCWFSTSCLELERNKSLCLHCIFFHLELHIEIIHFNEKLCNHLPCLLVRWLQTMQLLILPIMYALYINAPFLFLLQAETVCVTQIRQFCQVTNARCGKALEEISWCIWSATYILEHYPYSSWVGWSVMQISLPLLCEVSYKCLGSW